MKTLVLRLFICILFFQTAISAKADWFPNPAAGTFRVEYDLYPVYQSDTSVTVRILRENGTDGDVSVYFETLDSGAQMWTDYVGQWGRLDWSNGDSTPKQVTISLMNTGLTVDKSFLVKLYSPTFGASLSTTKHTAKVQISSTNHSRLPSYILKRQFPTIGFINGLLIEGAYHGVSGIGDVDGDGREDLGVGAYYDSTSYCAAGALYVLQQISHLAKDILHAESNSASSKITGSASYLVSFGNSISGIGDVNGDGYNDFIVGSDRRFPGDLYGGFPYLVFGKSGGITSGTIEALVGNGEAIKIRSGPFYWEDDAIQLRLTSAGDFNNDGYSDFIITEDFYGSVRSYLVFGKSSFSSEIILSEMFPPEGVCFSFESVESAGDFNGDGLNDIVSFEKFSEDYMNYVFHGGTSFFFDEGILLPYDSTNYIFMAGTPAKTVGDINGDGYSDIAGYFSDEPLSDLIWVKFGSPDGIIPYSNLVPDLLIRWPGKIEEFNALGDLNGDGYMDFGIRGKTKEFGTGNTLELPDGGYIGVIYGSSTGVGVNFSPDFYGNIDFTNKVDGVNALIIEDSINSQRSKFSNSFRHAGDINQDGISDLIIGYGVPEETIDDIYNLCYTNPNNSYVIHGKGSAQTPKYTSFSAAGNTGYRGVGMVQDGSHSTPFSRVWINHTGGTLSKEEVTLYRNKSFFSNCPADTMNVGWKITTNRTGQSSTKIRFKYLDSEIVAGENALAVLSAPTPSGPWVKANKIGQNLLKNEITIELTSLPIGEQYYILAPLGSVYEKGSVVVLDQEIPVPAVHVNSYNFANCSGSSDSLQTISSHIHVKQSQRSGATGSVKASRSLWNLGNQLCPTVNPACGDTHYTSYSLTSIGNSLFTLSGVANPWTESSCSSVIDPNSELNFPLNAHQLNGQTTVSVVGPEVWTGISYFPTSSSHSPTTITVEIGPNSIVVQEVALTIYNKANTAQRRTLRSSVQNNVFTWDGIVYNQPLPESPETGGFYLSSSANIGMNLTVKVTDTFTDVTTYSVEKQFTWNFDQWSAGPQSGTGYELYTPLE